jgi:hypothetical protein
MTPFFLELEPRNIIARGSTTLEQAKAILGRSQALAQEFGDVSGDSFHVSKADCRAAFEGLADTLMCKGGRMYIYILDGGSCVSGVQPCRPDEDPAS